jgi:hypothetical protein
LKFSISAKLHFEFNLTVDQVNMLMKLGELHYDGHCRSCVRSGGHVYGWLNAVNFSGSENQSMVSGTWRDLDSTLKIMEFLPPTPAITSAQRQLAEELRGKLMLAMDEGQRLTKLWQIEVDV